LNLVVPRATQRVEDEQRFTSMVIGSGRRLCNSEFLGAPNAPQTTAIPTQKASPAPDRFRIKGVLVAPDGTLLQGKVVHLYPVGRDSTAIIFLVPNKYGNMVPLGYNSRTAAKGESSINIPRGFVFSDYSVKEWMLALQEPCRPEKWLSFGNGIPVRLHGIVLPGFPEDTNVFRSKDRDILRRVFPCLY
jgi:hypothetical protein